MIDDKYLDGQAKLCGWHGTIVYISLCRHSNKDQESFPSIKLMSEQHGVSRDTIIKGLKKLEDRSLIKIKKTRSKSGAWLNNTYILLDKTDWIYDQVDLSDLANQVDLSVTPSRPQRNTKSTTPTLRKHIEGNTSKETHSFLHRADGARETFQKSLDTIGKKTIPSEPPKKIPETFTEKVNELQIMKEEDVPYKDVTEVISYFLPLLPSQFVTKSPFLQKPTQNIVRKALTMATKEDLKSLIEKYHSKQTEKFRPTIATVYTFFSKIDQIRVFTGQSASGTWAQRSISSPEGRAASDKKWEEVLEKNKVEAKKVREDYKKTGKLNN